MRRREFITLLGSAAAMWPVAAGAQQAGGMRRIGVLMGSVENDPEDRSWVAEFVQQLQKLSWTEGKNIRIDYRWGGGDVSRTASYAAELVDLSPDAILTQGATTLKALLQQTRSVPIVFVRVQTPLAVALSRTSRDRAATLPGSRNLSTRSPGNGWKHSSRLRPT